MPAKNNKLTKDINLRHEIYLFILKQNKYIFKVSL